MIKGNKQREVNTMDHKKCLAMMWLNNTQIIKRNLSKEKPCLSLGWCPYGQLVEAFDLREKTHKKVSCKLFGHDCPAFYLAENVAEDKKKEIYKKMMEVKK